MSLSLSAVSERIWDLKYRLKQADGTPVDGTVGDTWRRVARALAAPEAEPARWAEAFAEALDGFRFLPAGRILAGAGSDRRVTLFNCFVMGRLADDMAGIFDSLGESALTMQQGGGIGVDFSTLRPRGARVRGVGADASGPVSFMRVWDAMCRTIMSAGHRRGAMMATLACDHPDIETFIDAKREAGELRMFNLSVLVSDAFMDAVRDGAAWPLRFAGAVHREVPARDLWQRIMRATYDAAEPGVIFIDRINARNNLAYCETIHATNPCVTAETWVHTGEGPRQVHSLVGRAFKARVNGRDYASGPAGFFSTGRKPVLEVRTRAGHRLRLTGNHKVLADGGRWVAAGDLAPGDEIVLNDHGGVPQWPGPYSEEQGYLIGLLVGDGTLKADKAVLSVWKTETTGAGADGIMEAALAAAKTLPHRADFTGWVPVKGRGEHRLSLAAVKALALDLGMEPGNKALTPKLEAASSAFTKGFLRGVFDADGTVTSGHGGGLGVRLAQSDMDRLRVVQRMLARLGIVSRIYAHRHPAGKKALPDGKGGHKTYRNRETHELVIGKNNVVRYFALIGFSDTDKQDKLETSLENYRKGPYRETFLATVASVEPDGEAEVFDVQVPGVNAFDANGCTVHNCGEQPLPDYGACLLGSINLAPLVRDPFDDSAALDTDSLRRLAGTAVRMLDNAIDVSHYPLPAQAEEARAKRRIGLGVTGLADALILCGVRYGSARAVQLTERWLGCLRDAAYRASAALAREKGAFPLFERDAFLAGGTVSELDGDLRDAIAAHGMRNGLVTSIAPTGTISLLADNVSSGIEPVYAFSHRRTVLMPGGAQSVEVRNRALRLFRDRFGEEAPLPPAFVDVQHLTPADHLAMQAAAQRYVDSAISKTVNCPEAIPFEDFESVYRRAWELGCKGCTTYRPNAVTGAVLEAGEAPDQGELPLGTLADAPADPYDAGRVVYMTQPLDRPEELPGNTYKLRWPESDHAIYVTVNDIVRDGRRRPFEIFINSRNMEHYAWTVGLMRMISAVFRRGGDVSFVVDELKAVFDPRGGQWVEGAYVPSLLAAIGEVIEKHMVAIGFLRPPDSPAAAHAAPGAGARGCRRCGHPTLVRQENCELCTHCGFSRCD